MTEQILKQKSKKLEQLLTDLAPDFGKLETKVNAVLEQGKKEGFSDMEIGDLIRSKMQEHYSDRTIRRVLPDTAKHPEKVRKQKDFADKLSANERPPLEIPTAKIEPTNKSLPPPEVRIVEGIENDGYTVTDTQSLQQDSKAAANQSTELQAQLSEPQMQQPNYPIIEQPQPEEVQGIHNIAPEEYDLDHLHEYDKDLLARIVIWLDTNSSDLSKLVTRRSEEVVELKNQLEEATKRYNTIHHKVDALEKKLGPIKPFVELFSTLPSEARDSWLQFMKNALEREKGLRK